MKIKNKEIIAILNTISKIKESDRKLPIKLSYVLNKNTNMLLEYYKPYEEALNEKGLIDLTPDKLNLLPKDKLKDFLDLYSYENDIDLLRVKLSDIYDANLSINELEIIQTFMLEE